ncbi:unnamed protein product [Protopolystoma xenopodis]|uniref:Uncharacterized protein n=1 Tax=Protopolystoma xenopodis TaxID=117903 RepID=A0A3S5FBW6_9PLAT|nr:unnamed protein product [Protopolystoma xenopodis]
MHLRLCLFIVLAIAVDVSKARPQMRDPDLIHETARLTDRLAHEFELLAEEDRGIQHSFGHFRGGPEETQNIAKRVDEFVQLGKSALTILQSVLKIVQSGQ